MLETLDYSKPRLLVVDDNKENRTWLARRLVRDGYQVIVAGSGADALEQIDLQPVNLVLLDVQMPDMDGLQVLEEIRKTFNEQEMPVLMVSANTDTPTKVAAMDGGANDYLQKPVEYDFLLAKLRGYLKRSGSGQVAGPPPTAAPAAPASTPAPTSTRVDVGDMVGHYRITGLLGEGGMGKVFRATDERLLRDVALKVMTSEGRPGNLGRFLTEARAVARIAHPCIATIYDISEQPVPYIAMELVQGRELQHHTGGHPVPVAQAVDWTRQIAETLQVVHEHGILHRDLKPANIMVTPDGRLKVMDFGLAKIAELDQKLTRTGELWGTPHYMSPEHFDPSRGPVDAQSDIFALAGIMFELLTARLAFASNAMGTLIFEIISQDPPLVHTLEPSVPPEVSAIVARGLAKQKADRYPNAAAMAADLRALQL